MKKYNLIPIYLFSLTVFLMVIEGCNKHNGAPASKPSGKVTATIGNSTFTSDLASASIMESIGTYFGSAKQGSSYLNLAVEPFRVNDTASFGTGYCRITYNPTGDSSTIYQTETNRSCGYYVCTIERMDSVGGYFTGWVYDAAGDSMNITNGSFLFINSSVIPEPPH